MVIWLNGYWGLLPSMTTLVPFLVAIQIVIGEKFTHKLPSDLQIHAVEHKQCDINVPTHIKPHTLNK